MSVILMYTLILANINVCIQFEVPTFTNFKDMTWSPKFKNVSRDPDTPIWG